MSNETQLELIQTYFTVCEYFDRNPQWKYIRLSNNSKPDKFTDQEAVTIYIFVARQQKCPNIKDIHLFAKRYLNDWFPTITSYEKFNKRLSVLTPIFYDIAIDLISMYIPEDIQTDTLMIDSMPIITCKSKNRTAKVARECTDKGYCSSKNLYYYGLKMHLLAFRREGKIPFPDKIYFSPASHSDLSVAKELNWFDNQDNIRIFADKIYIDKHYFAQRKQIELMTPIKVVKGTDKCIAQRDLSAVRLWSSAASKVR
jgi:hypothetical protein